MIDTGFSISDTFPAIGLLGLISCSDSFLDLSCNGSFVIYIGHRGRSLM
jgi:hypothetical protein